MHLPELPISPNTSNIDGSSPEPFDAVAHRYDSDFSDTPLGRFKRGIVHRYLKSVVGNRTRVLELNCGTGIDALWLASRGCRVTATDASEGMLDVARTRIMNTPEAELVRFRKMTKQSKASWAAWI